MGMRSPIFQPKRSGVRWPNNGAFAVFQKGLPLIFGDHQFRENLALVFGVDHELREKILVVLIHAAEPVIVGDRLHSGNAQDFVAIGKWNWIDDGGAVDDDQAVGAGDVRAAVKGSVNNAQERKQKQCHRKRSQRKHKSQFLAKQIGKNQAAEFHHAPPTELSWRTCGLPPARLYPGAAWCWPAPPPADRA